jgi:hypothetical protein
VVYAAQAVRLRYERLNSMRIVMRGVQTCSVRRLRRQGRETRDLLWPVKYLGIHEMVAQQINTTLMKPPHAGQDVECYIASYDASPSFSALSRRII